MDALDVETSIAEGEQALQALLQFARETCRQARGARSGEGHLQAAAAHWVGGDEALLRPARDGRCGTGRHAGRRRAPAAGDRQLRGRDYFSLFGKFAVARTCYRTPGEPGIFPLDAQVNLPERCYSYFLQEWMTVFEVEHPFKESAGWFEQLFDLEVAESVLMEVAKEAPAGLRGLLCAAARAPRRTPRASSWW